MINPELLQHANLYIQKLAKGINPIDNTPIPKDDIVNNPQISECLLFVSKFLEESLNNKPKSKSSKKDNFYITNEELRDLEFSEKPIYISDLVAKINKFKPSEDMKNLSYANVAEWLVKNEYMDYTKEGSNKKYPTEKGEKIGIYTEILKGRTGFYKAVFLNINAQKFIIENIDSIIKSITEQPLEFNNKFKESADISDKTNKNTSHTNLDSLDTLKPKLTIHKLSPDEVTQFNFLNNASYKNDIEIDDILDIEF